jgi:hypothetical protein
MLIVNYKESKDMKICGYTCKILPGIVSGVVSVGNVSRVLFPEGRSSKLSEKDGEFGEAAYTRK